MSVKAEESAASTIFVCSDSSDDRWGYNILTHDGHSLTWSDIGFVWNVDLQPQHIYVKECIAAIWTIQRLIEERPVRFVIGIDNSAAAAALRRLYSPNGIVASHLSSLATQLERTNSTIQVVGVRSADNASDPASRGGQFSATLAHTCWEILSRAQAGQNIGGDGEDVTFHDHDAFDHPTTSEPERQLGPTAQRHCAVIEY